MDIEQELIQKIIMKCDSCHKEITGKIVKFTYECTDCEDYSGFVDKKQISICDNKDCLINTNMRYCYNRLIRIQE